MNASQPALALITAVLAASALLAQSQPATDRSSPQAAAKSLYLAIAAADRAAVADSLYAADDSQRQLAGAMADLLVAGKKLGDAARQRYGKSGDPIGRGMLDPADLSKLDSATVKESGDTATVTVEGQPRPMSFRKQGEQWRLVVTDFGGAAPENIAKQIKLVSQMAAAVNESATEVAAGKYPTAQEAENVIQQRFHAVMIDNYRPASAPATAPAAH